MAPSMSASTLVSTHLDELVRLATLLTGNSAAAEDQVREAVRHALSGLPTDEAEALDVLRQQVVTRQRRRVAIARRSGVRNAGEWRLVGADTPYGMWIRRRQVRIWADVGCSLLRGSDPSGAEPNGAEPSGADHAVLAALQRLTRRHRVDLVREHYLGLPPGTPRHPSGRPWARTGRLPEDNRWLDGSGDRSRWERLVHAVDGVRASEQLRFDLLAAAAHPSRSAPRAGSGENRAWSRSAAATSFAVAAAAKLVVGAVLTDRSPASPVEDTLAGIAAAPVPGDRPVPGPASTERPLQSPTVAGMIGAPCDDAGSDHLRPMADAATAEVVALCWPIETGLGTVWATGRLDPNTTAGSTALAGLDRITDRECRTTTAAFTPGQVRSPIRPVLLREYSVRYGCLAGPSDAITTAEFRAIAPVIDWSVQATTASCDPRVSDGQIYRPYARMAGEDWDIGVICVDAPGTGAPTRFLVLTGPRLALMQSLVDRWPRLDSTPFCQDSEPRTTRVALWLSRNDSPGLVTGVFGPRACALDPALTDAFRLITDPANADKVLPDLSGMTLDQVVTTLLEAGFRTS